MTLRPATTPPGEDNDKQTSILHSLGTGCGFEWFGLHHGACFDFQTPPSACTYTVTISAQVGRISLSTKAEPMSSSGRAGGGGESHIRGVPPEEISISPRPRAPELGGISRRQGAFYESETKAVRTSIVFFFVASITWAWARTS